MSAQADSRRQDMNETHTGSNVDVSDALRRLAQAADIAIEWTDAFGNQQQVPSATLRAVLQALQLPCDSDADCEAAIAALAQEEIMLAIPPLITAQVGRETELSPYAHVHGQPYRIAFEDGELADGYLSDDRTRPARLPAFERVGYHRLYIGEHHSVTLAVAPLCCFTVADAVGDDETTSPRLWALAAQLYSLRKENDDAGIGDFSALEILVRSAAHRGASAIAISPVHAMFSANPYQYSPYGPSSRLFFNVLHIDPAAISGRKALADAIERLEADSERQRLRDCELIDWPAAARWRLAVLRELFDHYDIRSDEWKEFEAFRLEGGVALEDHARFEALHAAMREKGVEGSWRSWPEPYRDPRSDGVLAFAEAHDNDIMFHVFLQWQAARGLQHAQQSARAAGMRIGLITDLAVGAEGGGSQSWSRQHQMLTGLSVGAPPGNGAPASASRSAHRPMCLARAGKTGDSRLFRRAHCANTAFRPTSKCCVLLSITPAVFASITFSD